MFNLLFKEFTLLKRDIWGLLILFVMPSVLLIVITCVQNMNYKNNSLIVPKIILVNNDSKVPNSNFLNPKNTGGAVFTDKINGNIITLDSAKALLAEGKFDAILYIPADTAKNIGTYFEDLFKYNKVVAVNNRIQLIFPKNINPLLAKSIQDALESASFKTQMYYLKLNVFKELDIEPEKNNLSTNSWLDTSYISEDKAYTRPSSVQQNVPAWALFGMFFIVVPLAASFIQERDSSVMLRLRTTSMKSYEFITSKFIAYVIINLCQLSLILVIGVYILPLFGIEKLDITGKLQDIFIVGLFCSFAATSFGILIGTIAKNQQQASMIGPTAIVIAAALGGIMVPVFLMPPALQQFCSYSPLFWGQKAFLKIIAFNQSIQTTEGELIKLAIFFAVCVVLSWLFFCKRK